jgi:hypothetical protein
MGGLVMDMGGIKERHKHVDVEQIGHDVSSRNSFTSSIPADCAPLILGKTGTPFRFVAAYLRLSTTGDAAETGEIVTSKPSGS